MSDNPPGSHVNFNIILSALLLNISFNNSFHSKIDFLKQKSSVNPFKNLAMMCWKLTTKFNFPHSINNEHFSFILFIHVIVFPPKVKLHFLHINPHTTHKSSNHSDKGPTLKMLAFKHFTVANVHFQLSC